MSKETETATPETDIKSVLNHPRNGYGHVVNDEVFRAIDAAIAQTKAKEGGK